MNTRYNSVALVPIEPQPYRYSAQWLEWFSDALFALSKEEACGLDWTVLEPSQDGAYDPPSGQFLDAVTTNEYKGRQIADLARALPTMEEPILVYFLDLWHPGVLSVGYMRDALDLDLGVKGILHAGTYDPWDFLAHKGMDDWARGFEASVFKVADSIHVGSGFHRDLVTDTFPSLLLDDTLTVGSFPVFTDPERRERQRERIVAFPHRDAVEKGHDTYLKVKSLYRDRYPSDEVSFVRTVDQYDEGMTPREKKDRFYDVLSRSSVVLSTARQETFGIAMQEGRNLGAWPVAPNRLAYPDTLPPGCCYDTLGEAVRLIRAFLDRDDRPSVLYGRNNARTLLRLALKTSD